MWVFNRLTTCCFPLSKFRRNMKKHRLFIALNFSEKINNRLFEFRDLWPEMPGRFVKKENLHLTLFFLGNMGDEEIAFLIEKLKKTAGKATSFELKLTELCYAPKDKKPRMLWACGPAVEGLSKLKEEMEKALGGEWYRREKGTFQPHVTLVRLRRFDPSELPEVKKKIDLTFPVDSFELMESKLEKVGAEYRVLESFQL